MLTVIKPVDSELLIEASTAVAARKGKGGDPAVSIIMHFDNRLDAEMLKCIAYRLVALSNLVEEGIGPGWVLNVKGKRYKLVNEAMFRAAAITPLSIDENDIIGNLAFDANTFLKTALAESETDGSA
jgi:hypothetical protein